MALAYIVRKGIVNASGTVTTARGAAILVGDIPAAQADRVVVYDDGGSAPVLPAQVPK